MNVDFIAGINNLGEKIYTCEPFKTSFQNPFIVALIITAVVLVVFFAICNPPVDKKRKTKTAIYVYICIVALLFLHYYVLNHQLNDIYNKSNMDVIVSSIHDKYKGGDEIIPPISPPSVSNELEEDQPKKIPAGPKPAGPKPADSKPVSSADSKPLVPLQEVIMPSQYNN
ncbi:pB169L [African swine fever virus]|uniref:PB169L n=1 Tax=African swine fever virus TaxID=10497 RepID=A0A6G6AGL6_ASF|nr:pB169L [African swine fever virus]